METSEKLCPEIQNDTNFWIMITRRFNIIITFDIFVGDELVTYVVLPNCNSKLSQKFVSNPF